GAVEHNAVDEGAFVGCRSHASRVLPLAARISEAEVDELHVLFLDHRENLFGVHCPSLFRLTLPHGRVSHTAASPRSPVRILIAVSTLDTNILPSPMRPVCAALRIASTAFSTISSSRISSSFTLGRKSTTYSAPR